ncbi:MAG: MBL fold metallo-hydrolase [Theionarchaea archaeon]|nr:MBL fold metallo-hydrolase [Theionarchaea archaeon]
MKIVYLGHACFRIVGSEAEVVTDPFTGIGLPDPEATADIVICSHGHRDHSHVGKTAKPGAEVLVGFVGEKSHAGVRIRGIPAYHDDDRGSRRGENSLYIFELDDLTLCHLGDLGHDLGEDGVNDIGGIDVLFIPVGGFFTIGPETASDIANRIDPGIVIPMHYRTPRHSPGFSSLSTVEDFAALRENVVRVGRELTVDSFALPDPPATMIMES